jgi:anti-anti-sigma factor
MITRPVDPDPAEWLRGCVSEMPDDPLHSATPAPSNTTVAEAIHRITTASDAMNAVLASQPDVVAQAKRQLAQAVGAARDLDVSWQTIGDALGMRRGAAYQRFRQRPPSNTLEIHESPIDGVTVLSARGELDAPTAPQMADAIRSALPHVPMGLIVDLSQVTLLTSAGMSALVEGDRAARRAGKRFGLVAEGRRTIRPMKVIGAIPMTYATVHAAMVGLHQRGASADKA